MYNKYDFRIRNRTSVYDDDLQKNMDDWVKNKMTSLGVYWINSERICSMKEKIESEKKWRVTNGDINSTEKNT